MRTSDLKIFPYKEINADKVMASACLPRMFKAVEIDGEYYWDGGFTGNPAMFPLIVNTKCKDLLIVELESVNHGLTWTVKHIEEREAEISFNSSLMREMDAIAMYNKGIDENKIIGEKVRMHYMNTGGLLNDYNRTARFNISWDWLSFLHDKGYKTASAWIKKNYAKIGEESSWIHPGLDK
ncbi:MAG: patatin-like phospholipase family protein [Candidatus Saccharibacteria bacterium]